MADADNASACGVGNFNLSMSSSAWSILWVFPKPFKELCGCWSFSCIASAEEVFGPLDVSVVMSHRFLDGFLGDVTARLLFCSGDPVGCWCPSSILNCHLSASYSLCSIDQVLAMWVDLLTACCPRSSDVECPLESMIHSSFLLAMLISSLKLNLFSLPMRFGGLGIFLPRHLANPLYNTSRSATHTIVDSILNTQHIDLDVHDDVVISAHSDYQEVCDILFHALFSDTKLDLLHLCALRGARSNDLSS